MTASTSLAETTTRLSEWISKKPNRAAEQKAALDHYGNLFRPETLPNLSEEEFKAFLLLKNNKHWSNINRHPSIYAGMERLREALAVLVDENRPIEDRLDDLNKGGSHHLMGLDKAVLTPILMCVYPEKYAVYNSISAEGLKRLGRNKVNGRNSLGQRYLAINEACKAIKEEIKQPLFLVDTMLALVVRQLGGTITMPVLEHAEKQAEADGAFNPHDDKDARERIAAMTGSLAFVLGAILLVANWPWTIFGIMPTNNVLMATEPKDAGPESRALIVKWNRLHSVRTALGGLATVAFLIALLSN